MADTVKLYFSEAGKGTPLVLLHGFPLNAGLWQDQKSQLSEHCRVITPDLRGHGQSPVTTGTYEMELLARDVFALLDSLNIKKAAIMGHSMGGYVALAGFRLAPERFLALGLIASQAAADTEEGRQGRFKMAEKVAAEGSVFVARALIPKLFAPRLPADAPIVEQVRQMMLNSAVDGIVGSLKGMAGRSDSGPLLAKVNIPTLIIAGNEDQIIAPAKAQAMASSIRGATLATIENAGHMPMLEQPQATTAAIRKFMGGLAG